MITRRRTLGIMAASLAPGSLLAAADGAKADVAADTLPSLADRLPKTPRIVNVAAMGRVPGQPGGQIRTLIGGQRDIRFMTITGYARLVGYDEHLVLQPDILEAIDVRDDLSFTFRIRDGHRWSDGQPLTAEDFRHAWDDVLNNAELRPGGLPGEMMAGGKPPVFEVLDTLTVSYVWEFPNPVFLTKLAAPQPLTLLFPAHYMKQFHVAYQDKDRLAELMTENRVENWTDLYVKMSRSYRPENPELPSLDPWVNTTPLPAEQFVFSRNPYFHRVDENGVQLPYVDRFILNISSASIIPAKAGAGESDLQTFAIDFSDYTYLKEAEHNHPVKVSLWKYIKGSTVALLPNLNCNDAVWRGVMQDVGVRRALSVAINRHEINMVSFFGLAQESADTVLPESPLFRPEYKTMWAQYDPGKANALLDASGLSARGEDGIRLLPDGRPMQVIVETAGESTLETDVLELITDHWRKIGVALFVRASQRDVFRSRAMAGEVMMSVWGGMDNAVPTADMSPENLAPTADSQLQWPLWGMYNYSRGKNGSPPDMPVAKQLLDLYHAWLGTRNSEERTAIWRQMLDITSDQVLTIGTVNSTLQPLIRSAALRNVPETGLYGFEPTSYLGVYLPDTFWLDRSA